MVGNRKYSEVPDNGCSQRTIETMSKLWARKRALYVLFPQGKRPKTTEFRTPEYPNILHKVKSVFLDTAIRLF